MRRGNIFKKFIRMVAVLMVCMIIGNKALIANANVLCNGNVKPGDEAYSDELAYNIDELYEERLRLCSDYEANKEEIALVDSKLEALGVEELTSEELYEKYNCQKQNALDEIMPLYSWIPTESGVKWTSRTYIQVDRGQLFEIEEVRGVRNGNDKLYKKYSVFLADDEKVKASDVIIKATALMVKGLLPGTTGTLLSSGITLGKMIKDLTGKEQNIVVEGTTVTTYVRAQNEIIMLFVKRYGSSDETEVLMYKGNHVQYDTTTTIPLMDSTPVGIEYPVVTHFDTSHLYSPNFDNKTYVAVSNFRNYESRYTITDDFLVRNIRIEFIDGSTRNLKVPMSDYVF